MNVMCTYRISSFLLLDTWKQVNPTQKDLVQTIDFHAVVNVVKDHTPKCLQNTYFAVHHITDTVFSVLSLPGYTFVRGHAFQSCNTKSCIKIKINLIVVGCTRTVSMWYKALTFWKVHYRHNLWNIEKGFTFSLSRWHWKVNAYFFCNKQQGGSARMF